MEKLGILFIFLLTVMGCLNTSYLLVFASDSEHDRDLYINTDLHVSFQQNQLSRIYPGFKPKKNNRVLNKSVKLTRLRLQNELLFYAEDFDQDVNAHLVEYYPKGLSPKKQYRKLKNRKFQKLVEQDGMLTYEKEVNGYEYFFGERLEPLEKGTLRIVNIARVGKSMIPNIWNKDDLSDFDRRVDSTGFSDEQLDQISKGYRKGLKNQIWRREMILRRFDKLDEDKWFKEMGEQFFQKDLHYNYGRLNKTLNRALENDTIVKSDEKSRLLAQTLLSYLARDGDIYRLEEKKSTRFDSTISKDAIVPIDDLFLSIKKQDIRLLMVNDAEHWSQCQYQVSKLLPKLKGLGFNTIFTKGVNMSDTLINYGDQIDRNIATTITFGNFLKKAQKLNYGIYGYISKDDRKNKNQIINIERANNIINTIKEKQLLNGESRVIVYCDSRSSKFLGQYLKEKLSTKVISIDQSALIGSEKLLAKKFSLIKNRTYLLKPNGFNGKGYDYYLFEPNDSYLTNSPDYAYDLGDVKVDIAKYFDSNVSFITIYSLHSRNNSIPIFAASKEMIKDSLGLSKGGYFIGRLGDSGQILNGKKLNVE